MKSILQKEKECFICRLIANSSDDYIFVPVTGLHDHHVFYGTANRKNSEKHGLKVWLCINHHTGDNGVHRNRTLDLDLKTRAQKVFEYKHSREEFIEVFGRNYL